MQGTIQGSQATRVSSYTVLVAARVRTRAGSSLVPVGFRAAPPARLKLGRNALTYTRLRLDFTSHTPVRVFRHVPSRALARLLTSI